MPQLARTGASVLPTTLQAQRTGLLKSLSSADRRSMSTKPENAVNVKFGSKTMPKRMRSFGMAAGIGGGGGDGWTAFMLGSAKRRCSGRAAEKSIAEWGGGSPICDFPPQIITSALSRVLRGQLWRRHPTAMPLLFYRRILRFGVLASIGNRTPQWHSRHGCGAAPFYETSRRLSR